MWQHKQPPKLSNLAANSDQHLLSSWAWGEGVSWPGLSLADGLGSLLGACAGWQGCERGEGTQWALVMPQVAGIAERIPPGHRLPLIMKDVSWTGSHGSGQGQEWAEMEVLFSNLCLHHICYHFSGQSKAQGEPKCKKWGKSYKVTRQT